MQALAGSSLRRRFLIRLAQYEPGAVFLWRAHLGSSPGYRDRRPGWITSTIGRQEWSWK